MKRGIDCLRGVFLAASLLLAVSAFAQSPQDILAQHVAALRKNPDDFALREKIIKHVQTMSPAPEIPEEARRHYVMGRTLLRDAKSPQETNEAADEFRKALAVAPWYPEANRYCGVALGIANRHDEAIVMLKLYIATNPPDARDAQDEIYAMEAKKIKAASDKAASVARAADEARAKAESEAKARLEGIEGTWCLFFWGACQPHSAGLMKIQRQAGSGWTVNFPNWEAMYAYDIRQAGKTISFTRMVRGSDPKLNTDYINLTLSGDGTRLKGTIRSISISGNRPQWVTDEHEYIRR